MANYQDTLVVAKDDYAKNFAMYGDSAQGVRWSSDSVALTVHGIFSKLIAEFPQADILDVGCGLAHFLKFLDEKGIPHGRYSGIDMVDEYILACKKKYPAQTFTQGTFFDTKDAPVSDIVISIGILNRNVDDVVMTTKNQIKFLYDHCTVACGFNILVENTNADTKKIPNFYYHDFVSMVDFCSTLTHSLQIHTEYAPHGCTIFLYK